MKNRIFLPNALPETSILPKIQNEKSRTLIKKEKKVKKIPIKLKDLTSSCGKDIPSVIFKEVELFSGSPTKSSLIQTGKVKEIQNLTPCRKASHEKQRFKIKSLKAIETNSFVFGDLIKEPKEKISRPISPWAYQNKFRLSTSLIRGFNF